MKNVIRWCIFPLVYVCFMAMLAGCGEEGSVYEHAQEYRASQQEKLKSMSDNTQAAFAEGTMNVEEAVNDTMASGTKYISKTLNRIGGFVIVSSLVIGIILMTILSHTKAIKLFKASIVVFIVTIPITTLLLIYGFAFFYSWFV